MIDNQPEMLNTFSDALTSLGMTNCKSFQSVQSAIFELNVKCLITVAQGGHNEFVTQILIVKLLV